MADPIYHVTSPSAWAEAESTGEYRWSTRGAAYEDVGFVHASFRHQVRRIATRLYPGEPAAVLVIDPDRVGAAVVAEPGVEGGTELFPHIYGPLPVAAVVDVVSVDSF